MPERRRRRLAPNRVVRAPAPSRTRRVTTERGRATEAEQQPRTRLGPHPAPAAANSTQEEAGGPAGSDRGEQQTSLRKDTREGGRHFLSGKGTPLLAIQPA